MELSAAAPHAVRPANLPVHLPKPASGATARTTELRSDLDKEGTLPGFSSTPQGTPVNPTRFYTHEPAPMGIADFGVTAGPPGGTAYAYSSSVFQGQAVVKSMSVTISGSSSKVTAFELNAVLSLSLNGVNYSYWIQNGLHLDAGTDEFSIGGAYVWNFSAGSAHLSAGELTGATGSILLSDTFYYIPSCGAGFPGQCATMTLPVTLTGRIVSSTAAGVPYVDYEYDLGSGWVTYDNVSFPHMAGARDTGFLVDGFAPTPYAASAFYDAEWVWVGAGGGSASVDQRSDITLALDYWNGHNLQSVPNAWNFGGDTGETASNISETAIMGGTPGAHVVSGPGTLGVLYNQSGVGYLNLTVPTLSSVTGVVDGAPVAISAGWVNLTLPVGSHSLYLQNYSNSSNQVTISPGRTSSVVLSGAGEVVVTETGLPSGVTWGVSVNGTPQSTTQRTIVYHLPNGSYSLSYASVPGYHLVGAHAQSFVLPGTTEVSIAFAESVYSVIFSEQGLPLGTPWWVSVNGTSTQSTVSTLVTAEPNGSASFAVGGPYEYLPTPASGTLTVYQGIGVPVDIQFSYRPTFIEGTVSPSSANVTIGGISQVVVGGTFNDSVTAGTYSLVVSAPGYLTQSTNVTATAGNASWENITLIAQHSSGGSHNPSTGSAPTIPVEVVAVIIVVVVGVVAAAVFVFSRRR